MKQKNMQDYEMNLIFLDTEYKDKIENEQRHTDELRSL